MDYYLIDHQALLLDARLLYAFDLFPEHTLLLFSTSLDYLNHLGSLPDEQGAKARKALNVLNEIMQPTNQTGRGYHITDNSLLRVTTLNTADQQDRLSAEEPLLAKDCQRFAATLDADEFLQVISPDETMADELKMSGIAVINPLTFVPDRQGGFHFPLAAHIFHGASRPSSDLALTLPVDTLRGAWQLKLWPPDFGRHPKNGRFAVLVCRLENQDAAAPSVSPAIVVASQKFLSDAQRNFQDPDIFALAKPGAKGFTFHERAKLELSVVTCALSEEDGGATFDNLGLSIRGTSRS